MSIKLRTGLVAAALIGGLAFAQAQAVIELTPEQRTTVYTTITKQKVRAAPAGVTFSVGAVVPAEVELYAMPAAVEVPTIRRYRYTVWNDQVVLVDPQSRKVVQIIER
jgi:hypothetical protein